MWRIVFLILFMAVSPLLAQQNYTPSDIEAGGNLFRANCVTCHGPDGDGVEGVELARGQFRRASSDDDLVGIIRNGIPNTAMPPGNYSEPNARTIVAYIRSMATSGERATNLPGDANRGKFLFEGQGACTSCHRVSGNGSRVGPDLSQVGSVRRAVELERSLLEPNAEVMPVNRFVRVVTRNGATITGRLMNQDSFTVQLIDSREQLVSLMKSNVREFAFINSPMPSYKDKLSSQELADLVSYLASLRGR